MALWCSRLARQPVTLEVDGSSPFGVAKKEVIRKDGFFFVIRTDENHFMRQSGGLSLVTGSTVTTP